MSMLTRGWRLAALATALVLCLGGCWAGGDSPPGASDPPVSRSQVVLADLPPLDTTQFVWKYRDHNVVLVSFDALQAAHVGCLGNSRDTTPGLDAVAQNSFTFTHDYSAASWTVPATMTWFTGVYPSEHKLTNKFAVYNERTQQPARLGELAPQLRTLAEILQQNGYATGGFTGNAGVSGEFGFDQGFDVYYHERQKFGSLDESIHRALEWLQEKQDEKFFLFLHGYDVHGQSTPAGGFDYRFVDRDYDYKFTGSQREQELLREEGLAHGELTLRDEDVRFWRALYDEKIQRADARFQAFLQTFEQLGLLDKTLFIITSDHGTEFYEHRRFDHGFALYDEHIHVPLFIRLPGQQGGRAITERVSSIDLLPTILDLLDVPVAESVRAQLRGSSLVPVMNGERAERDIFSETDYREYTFQRSLITQGGWKLIYTLENRSRQLFNLNDDPAELHDLAASQPELADALQQKLFAHFRAIGHDLTARTWAPGLNPVYDSQARP